MIWFASSGRDTLGRCQREQRFNLWGMTYAIIKYIGVPSAMRLNVRMNRPSSCRAGFLEIEETVRAVTSSRSQRRERTRQM